jgi:hypothetical protein
VSENKHLNAVFTDLLDTQGMEIYLKPAADYVALGQPVTFYTVVAAAARRGEVAIGHRRGAGLHGHRGGIRLNPSKGEAVPYAAEDRIIVIAAD